MENILKRVYLSKKTGIALKIISHASVIAGVIAWVAVLIYTYLQEPLAALKLAMSCLIPFVLVSAVRALINAPRPYELYGFYEVKPKGKSGKSFPSRHVFSAFVIATVTVTVFPILSAILFVVGIILAVSRVLLGIHFIRDVIAGAVIGIVSGLLGIIIM